jgi:hypothetical protein
MMLIVYPFKPMDGHAPRYCESMRHNRRDFKATLIALIFEKENGGVRESFHLCEDCGAAASALMETEIPAEVPPESITAEVLVSED